MKMHPLIKTLESLFSSSTKLIESTKIFSILTLADKIPPTMLPLHRMLEADPSVPIKISVISKIPGFNILAEHSKDFQTRLHLLPEFFSDLIELTADFFDFLSELQNSSESLLSVPTFRVKILKVFSSIMKARLFLSKNMKIRKFVNVYFITFINYNDTEYPDSKIITDLFSSLWAKNGVYNLPLEKYASIFTPIVKENLSTLASVSSFHNLKKSNLFSFRENNVTLKKENENLTDMKKYLDFLWVAEVEVGVIFLTAMVPSILSDEETKKDWMALFSSRRNVFVLGSHSLDLKEIVDDVISPNKKAYNLHKKEISSLFAAEEVQNFLEEAKSIFEYFCFQLKFLTEFLESEQELVSAFPMKLIAFLNLVKYVINSLALNISLGVSNKSFIPEVYYLMILKIISLVEKVEKQFVIGFPKIFEGFVSFFNEFNYFKSERFSKIKEETENLKITGDFSEAVLKKMELIQLFVPSSEISLSDLDIGEGEELVKIKSVYTKLIVFLESREHYMNAFNYSYLLFSKKITPFLYSSAITLNSFSEAGIFINLWKKVRVQNFSSYFEESASILPALSEQETKFKEYLLGLINNSIQKFLFIRFQLLKDSINPVYYNNAEIRSRTGNTKAPKKLLPGSESSFLQFQRTDPIRSIYSVLVSISELLRNYSGEFISDILSQVSDKISEAIRFFVKEIISSGKYHTPQSLIEIIEFLFYSIFALPKGIFTGSTNEIISKSFMQIIDEKFENDVSFREKILKGYVEIIEMNRGRRNVVWLEDIETFHTVSKKDEKNKEIDYSFLTMTNPKSLENLFKLFGYKVFEEVEEKIIHNIVKRVHKIRQKIIEQKEVLNEIDLEKFKDSEYLQSKMNAIETSSVIKISSHIGILMNLRKILQKGLKNNFLEYHPGIASIAGSIKNLLEDESSEKWLETEKFLSAVGVSLPELDFKLFESLKESFNRSKHVIKVFSKFIIMGLLKLDWEKLVVDKSSNYFLNNMGSCFETIKFFIGVKIKITTEEEISNLKMKEMIKKEMFEFVEELGNVMLQLTMQENFNDEKRLKIAKFMELMVVKIGLTKEIMEKRFVSVSSLVNLLT